ncbi:MAG: hypothetical protein LBC64_06020 [Fibromonadaceae bacterium]|jgi:hypothetical protein|nr:hypothetical protein [Fibromonadaceae bacterium]
MKGQNPILMVAISIALAFIFVGCAQNAFLSKGMPESFFSDAKIDIADSKSVSYTFESKLADPFPYYKDFVDLNPSYKSVLKNYMNYKYTTVGSEGGDYHIDVILEECTYEAVQAGTETAHAYSSTGASVTAHVYNIKVTTEMAVKVRVNAGGKVSEKTINGTGEYTGNYSDASTVTKSFDLAIRATISRMDKFLNSIISAAATDP